MKHTPGPWKHGKTISGNFGVWATPLQYHVLDASAPGIDAEANARLIASAPDLLAALQACEALLDGRQPKDIPGALMVIRSAIAKAQA